MEDIKKSRMELIASCFNECVAYRPVIISYNEKTIEIIGKDTVFYFQMALLAMQSQAKVTTRIRDRFNVSHYVTADELKTIIAKAAIWGDQQWNKKVDLQEEIDNITAESAGSEEAAIEAINTVVWN